MKNFFKKAGKIFGGVICVVIGLAISGFGVMQLLPGKHYGGGMVDVTVPAPETE